MFLDVSHLIAHNPPGLHYGVAVADLDGDGRFAFVVAGFGGPNRVLAWAGGRLRDVAPPELADDRPAGRRARRRRHRRRRPRRTLRPQHRHVRRPEAVTPTGCSTPHPDGRWEDLFARPENAGVRNLAAGRSVAVIDRRGVGRYGFFVANHGRPMRLYELGPDGAARRPGPAAGPRSHRRRPRRARAAGLLGPPGHLLRERAGAELRVPQPRRRHVRGVRRRTRPARPRGARPRGHGVRRRRASSGCAGGTGTARTG